MNSIEAALAAIKESSGAGPRLLIALIELIRPQNKKDLAKASEKFNILVEALDKDEALRVSFRRYLQRAFFARKQKSMLFTEAGIPSNEGFYTEIRTKIAYAMIPPLEKRNDLLLLVNKLFPRRNDFAWLKSIPVESWLRFFRIVGLKEFRLLPNGHPFREAVENAMQIISYRISSIGLEPKITQKLPELSRPESPFMEQNKELVHHLAKLNSADYDEDDRRNDYKHLLVMINQCDDYAKAISKQKHKFGTSLGLTNMMLRLQANINRLKTLLHLLHEDPAEESLARELSLFLELVTALNKKQNLSAFISGHMSLMTYQITEHSGKTGEHYISHNKHEFMKLGMAALGGGAIVAFFTVFKAKLEALHLSTLIEALAFGLNYAIGFLLIFITHSTLATKHPAMTAQRVAKELDEKGPTAGNLDNLTAFIVKVIRSQAIAFAGNIVMAFLIAVLLTEIYDALAGEPLIEAGKAHHLIEDLHPWKSLALFHAAIAGVGLFLTGVVSGFYDNQSLYHQVSARLKRHPLFRGFHKSRRFIRLANYIGDNMGNLAGNIFLGFYLGSISAIGVLVHLPLDIRHVTFSSGNLGLAMGRLDQAPANIIVVSAVGVLLIGLINFSFSFGLAMAVAIKSREIRFRQSAVLLRKLAVYFFKYPLDFIFPPSEEREERDKNLAGNKG